MNTCSLPFSSTADRAPSEAINISPTSSTTSTSVSRLLDAVEVLCAEMDPSGVTMRMVSAEAGLSLGLAYRYFESRDELFGAALDRMGERIVAEAAGEDLMTVIPALWRAAGDNPAFPRLVTSFAMSGRYAPDVMSEDPMVRRITNASVALGIDDPGTVAGVTGMLVLTGAMFAPTLNRAIGRDPGDPRIYDATAAMMALWLTDVGAGVSRE